MSEQGRPTPRTGHASPPLPLVVHAPAWACVHESQQPFSVLTSLCVSACQITARAHARVQDMLHAQDVKNEHIFKGVLAAFELLDQDFAGSPSSKNDLTFPKTLVCSYLMVMKIE